MNRSLSGFLLSHRVPGIVFKSTRLLGTSLSEFGFLIYHVIRPLTKPPAQPASERAAVFTSWRLPQGVILCVGTGVRVSTLRLPRAPEGGMLRVDPEPFESLTAPREIEGRLF